MGDRQLIPFDQAGRFAAVPQGDKLRRTAIKGAGVTVFSSAVSLGVQIAATITLARLLTPADFGLVAMVTTFSLLLANFGLNGVTEAILQAPEMDSGLASNLFWINLSAGSLLTMAFAGAGSAMAIFYGDRRVAQVAAGMSFTIVLTSASVVHLALLKRAMRFSSVSVIDIAARVTLVVVSIILAGCGWGCWALVSGAVGQAAMQSLGAWILCRWMPRRPCRRAETGAMVRFAANTYGRFTINYFTRNVDNLLVGWRFDAQALGFYKKAFDLFALSANQLTAPLTNVAVSALSRLKGDRPQYNRYLLNALSVMALIGMGLSGALTLTGKDLIRVLLGPAWEPAGRIFTFFGPGTGAMLLYGMHGWIHLSIGRADRWFRWSLVEVSVTTLLFIVGLQWGALGVAVAWTTSFWLLLIPAFWYAGEPIQLGVRPIIVIVGKYVAASAAGWWASMFILQKFPYFGSVGTLGLGLRILASSSMFGVFYLGAVTLLHQGAAPLVLVWRLVRESIPSRRTLPIALAAGAASASVGPVVS